MTTENEFEIIYNTHASKVYRVCLGYASGNNDLANEWLQETFIKVWKHKNSFKGNASIDTWIYRIAVNVCLSDLRKSRKNMTLNEHFISNMSIDDNDRDNEDEEKKLKKMHHCINLLSEQNKALILLELENIPQATIANTVGLANGTLRTRLSRIRKSLLKCIKNGK